MDSSAPTRTFIRAAIVWLLIIPTEIVHGVIRAILLVPVVGDFPSRQIGVFTGSALFFLVTLAFVRWIGFANARSALLAGAAWAVATFAFELLFGRYVAGASWERLFSDYDLLRGGFMPLGLVLMALCPYAAARVRGLLRDDPQFNSRPKN
jgi:hypothetical protein